MESYIIKTLAALRSNKWQFGKFFFYFLNLNTNIGVQQVAGELPLMRTKGKKLWHSPWPPPGSGRTLGYQSVQGYQNVQDDAG